jgi:hypothetical protein
VVYVDANYLGESAHIADDIPDLREVRGPCEHYESPTVGVPGSGGFRYDWNDCISSIRVAPGWLAIVYRDDGYRDDSLTIAEDAPNLQLVEHDCPARGLNDCITSVRVRRR